MADIKAIAAELVALTVQEVIDLKNELKETYGIEPAAAAVVVAAGGEGAEHFLRLSQKSRYAQEQAAGTLIRFTGLTLFSDGCYTVRNAVVVEWQTPGT